MRDDGGERRSLGAVGHISTHHRLLGIVAEVQIALRLCPTRADPFGSDVSEQGCDFKLETMKIISFFFAQRPSRTRESPSSPAHLSQTRHTWVSI